MPLRPRRPRPGSRVLVGCLVVGLLAGCAGADDAAPVPVAPAPSSPAAPAAPVTTATAGTTGPATSAVTLDPDVFAYDELEEHSYETFVVAGADDPRTSAAVVQALRRAGNRFLATDETGVEHRSGAEVEAAAVAGLYTPNYVSDPTPTAAGVEVYVDCKGVIEDAMAATFRRVLTEELAQVGVPLRVSVAGY